MARLVYGSDGSERRIGRTVVLPAPGRLVALAQFSGYGAMFVPCASGPVHVGKEGSQVGVGLARPGRYRP